MKSVIVTLALLFAGHAWAAAGDLKLKPCADPKVKQPAQCGTYTVWENREAKSGRTIDLNVVVLQATGKDRKPDPLFILPRRTWRRRREQRSGVVRGRSDSQRPRPGVRRRARHRQIERPALPDPEGRSAAGLHADAESRCDQGLSYGTPEARGPALLPDDVRDGRSRRRPRRARLRQDQPRRRLVRHGSLARIHSTAR